MNSVNDLNILSAIVDRNPKSSRGRILSDGTTKKEIQSITQLPMTKIGQTLAIFLEQGLIVKGLNKKNAKTYVITNKGLEELLKFKGVDIDG